MRTFLLAIAFAALAAGAGNQPVNSRGSSSAPITLDLYSDFQCPACKLMYETRLKPLMLNDVDKGKVYLVHHEFPLRMHAFAVEASSYACAARRIGKYDQVADVLFREQPSWSVTGKVADAVSSVLTPEEAKKVRALAKDPSVLAEIQSGMFFALMTRAFVKGMGIDCGCFGLGEAISARTLLRDGLLLASSIALTLLAWISNRVPAKAPA